jgi:hypothetical protein
MELVDLKLRKIMREEICEELELEIVEESELPEFDVLLQREYEA